MEWRIFKCCSDKLALALQLQVECVQLLCDVSEESSVFQPGGIIKLWKIHAALLHEGLYLCSQLKNPLHHILPAQATYLCEVQNIAICCISFLQKGTELAMVYVPGSDLVYTFYTTDITFSNLKLLQHSAC